MDVFVARSALKGEATQQVNRALRLSSNDFQTSTCRPLWQMLTSLPVVMRKHPRGRNWLCEENPDFTIAAYVAGASNVRAEADDAMAVVREQNPTFRVTNLRKLYPFRRPREFRQMASCLRLAGQPE
jgi:hypothetical protein